MTSTMTNVFPIERPSRWNLLFAEDSDKDLDFDEGFEEDELHQSKPPSRRPLLWILLLILVGGVAYWTLNNQPSQESGTALIEPSENLNGVPDEELQTEIASPHFGEDQHVILTIASGDTMLAGDPTNSQPGPLVKNGEQLTIIDGSHEITGWVYQVKTASGKTGWITEDKLKLSS